MTSLNNYLFFLAMLTAATALGQGEGEAALPYNPALIGQRITPISANDVQRASDTVLELPFFDDFSRYSLATEDASIPAEWQRWCDNHVFINNGYPVQPPTIGVATFDGLKADGYPWNWAADNTFGPADTLTSLPIDLSGLTSVDNVYLSFYYQTGGRGDAPESNDNLILELYADIGGGDWVEVWSADGFPQTDFEKVYINVAETDFGDNIFQEGFQFRFRTNCTTSGAFDNWHLDYVEVRQNINPENDPLQELAYMYPVTTLLGNYTAMPWDHFQENPEFFMDPDTVFTYQRNLGETVNFVSGYKVEGPDQSWDFLNPFANTSGNEFSVIRTEMSVQGTGGQAIVNNAFVYETNATPEADTCAVFNVTFYHDDTDQTPQNDSAHFQQVFTNYYAYDDGSAERAYVVNPSGDIGSKLALRYNVEKDDELLGLFIHFLPYGDFSYEENFILRAWTDESGVPGEEIGGNFTFQQPQYHITGHNVFTYYAYEEPIAVSEGPLFVGFNKTGSTPLNIANDKSGLNKNPEHLFFQVAEGTDWIQSQITGSLMIRPVFRSGKSGVIWNEVEEEEAATLAIFPNPVQDLLTLDPGDYLGRYEVRVFDLTGQLVAQLPAQQGRVTWTATDLAPGAYVVTATDENGRSLARQTVIKH